jgi:hypothetical protein
MSRPRRRVAARLAAAALVAAGVGSVEAATLPHATAAGCGSSSGVTVVVDFGSLGGGVQSTCISGGGGQRASSLFPAAGYDLTPVQNEPGFVCRINGRPSPDDEACVNTPPDDAYWGLWWSDGTSGSWSYSNYGGSSLKVPDGGYVGFAWQTGSKNAPGLSPAPHAAPTPTQTPSPAPTTPSSKPTTKPSSKPGGKPRPSSSPTTKPSPGTGSTPAATTAVPTVSGSTTPAQPPGQPSDQPSDAPTAQPTDLPTDLPSALPTTEIAQPGGTTTATPPSDLTSVPPAADPGEPGAGSGGALPAWVVLVVLVLLLGAGAATALVRRRNRPSP